MPTTKASVYLTLYRMAVLAMIGLAVGSISAFATVGFVELVYWLNQQLYVSSTSRHLLTPGILASITIAVLTIGGLVVGMILHFGVREKRPLGPTDVIYAVQLREKLPTPTSGLLSTLAAALSMGCGASVGQYSPLVYLGALIGQLSERLRLGVRDIHSIAIACGIAAAISTAFNAPIAGLIFTHEVILRHYSLRVFTAVTVAAASGFVVDNVVFQHPPMFLVEFNQGFHTAEFFLFALEGLACGLLAVAFMKLLEKATHWSQQIHIHAVFKPMLAGFLTALVALQVPEVLGADKNLLRMTIESSHYSAFDLAVILVTKILVTALCIGFGFAGGVILPALLIGVLFGALFAALVPELLLSYYSGLSVYAVCGMVALVSPVIGTPLTALLIIFELTRNYEITIAAMVAIVFANLVAYHCYGRSLFDTQLLKQHRLDLSLGRDRAYLQHRKVTEYLTNDIPLIRSDCNCRQLRAQMMHQTIQSVAVIDQNGGYQGMIFHSQLHQQDDETPVIELANQSGIEFDENTSLWLAMENLRGYIGDAVPVVHSQTRRYLGALPEAVVISAYLDVVDDVRREEYEA